MVGAVRSVRVRSAKNFNNLSSPRFYCVTQITRISLVSLTYTARTPLENQRSDTNSIMTKTEFVLRARTHSHTIQTEQHNSHTHTHRYCGACKRFAKSFEHRQAHYKFRLGSHTLCLRLVGISTSRSSRTFRTVLKKQECHRFCRGHTSVCVRTLDKIVCEPTRMSKHCVGRYFVSCHVKQCQTEHFAPQEACLVADYNRSVYAKTFQGESGVSTSASNENFSVVS